MSQGRRNRERQSKAYRLRRSLAHYRGLHPGRRPGDCEWCDRPKIVGDGSHHLVARYSPQRHCYERWILCTYRSHSQRGPFD